MRYFLSKTGKLRALSTDHGVYANVIAKMPLEKYMETFIRIKIHRDVMAIETNQEGITSSQYTKIRKLYKDHQCLEFIGRVDNEIITTIKELRSQIL